MANKTITKITYIVQEVFVKPNNPDAIYWHNDSAGHDTIEVARNWLKIWQKETPNSKFRIIKKTVVETEEVVDMIISAN